MTAIVANLIIAIVLIALVSLACVYLYRQNKKGNHCVGCPMAGNCPKSKMYSGKSSDSDDVCRREQIGV